MDRPEQPERTEPSSIFSKPDPLDEPMPAVPPQGERTLDPLDVSTWAPPAPLEDASYPPRSGGPRPPSRDRRGPSRRMLIGIAAAGGAVILLWSLVAFSILGNDEPPPVAAGDASPTPALSSSAQPTIAASAEPSATPEPTPKPTPAGPPVELAVGDWATVTADELHVRAAAGQNQDSRYRLIRGAVVTVAEGPVAANGGNWYRVASLGGAAGWVSSGWIADPYLDTILNDPVLIRCGEVANPVFELVDGAPQAREVLRVGDFAVPANKLDVVTLATIELARGTGTEVCVTAQVGSDGLPLLRSEPAVSACGHAVADGQAFWLRPAADMDGDVAYQIKDPALVHPILLTGPADHRMTDNLRTLLTMMSRDGAAGCVDSNVNVGRDGVTTHHKGANLRQCSIVSAFSDTSIQLRPATGGPTVWIKFQKDGYRPEMPLETPVDVVLSASVAPDGLYADAWSNYGYETEECA